MDNAKYHTSNEVKEFCKREKIKCITLPPYCPELNVTEILINYLKRKVEKSFKFEK